MKEFEYLVSATIPVLTQGGALSGLLIALSISAYYLIFIGLWTVRAHRRSSNHSAKLDTVASQIALASILIYCAPLIGLLGTVQGMIGGFAAIADTATPQPQFARHISAALTTTGLGLVIALPAMLGLRQLQRQHAFAKRLLLAQTGDQRL